MFRDKGYEVLYTKEDKVCRYIHVVQLCSAHVQDRAIRIEEKLDVILSILKKVYYIHGVCYNYYIACIFILYRVIKEGAGVGGEVDDTCCVS